MTELEKAELVEKALGGITCVICGGLITSRVWIFTCSGECANDLADKHDSGDILMSEALKRDHRYHTRFGIKVDPDNPVI
jgi:hypothetical protein